MEEIRNDEIEQVSGGTYEEERSLRDFVNRFIRELANRPFSDPNPRPVLG